MKILVTGAAGFIGSWVFNLLSKKGHKVYGVDNLKRGKLSNLNNKKNFFKLDLTNEKDVKSFIKKKGPFTTIIHLATLINEGIEHEKLSQDININLIASIRLIEHGYQAGLKNFIYGSSIAVYGKIKKKIITETDQTNPITSYGISKLMAENYIKYLVKHKFNKMNYVILRYSNIYGPNQTDLGEVGVVRNFAKNLKRNNYIIKHGNGKQIRDYLYVRDAAEATIKSINIGKKNAVLNLTYGSSKSVNYIIKIFKSLLKKKIKIKKRSFHSGEYYYFKASNKLIKNKLNWSPKVSLKDGIQITLKQFFKI